MSKTYSQPSKMFISHYVHMLLMCSLPSTVFISTAPTPPLPSPSDHLLSSSPTPTPLHWLLPPQLHSYPSPPSPSQLSCVFSHPHSLRFQGCYLAFIDADLFNYTHFHNLLSCNFMNLLLFQTEQISLTTHTFPTKIMGAGKEGWGWGGSSLVKIVVLIFVNFMLPPENWYKQKITPNCFQWFVNFRLSNFINAFCGTNSLSVIFWLMCWLSLDTLWFVG